MAEAKTKKKPTRRPRRLSGIEVADRLLELLYEGVYQPGERLIEVEIAERFGISRGPVREALRILGARGVVHIRPMRGATVVRMSDEEALESIEISGVLFGLAARRAARNHAEADLSGFKSHVAELTKLAETDIKPSEFFNTLLDGGVIVAEAAKSKRLRSVLQDVRVGVPTMFGPLSCATREARARTAREWTDLAEAISKGDAKTAEKIGVQLHQTAIETIKEITS